MWRKNRSVHMNNRCVGTDLNRNFASKHWCGEHLFPVSLHAHDERSPGLQGVHREVLAELADNLITNILSN